MKIDKTNCIPTRTCESYLVNAANDQNNPNCTSLKLPMNVIDSKSSNVITRCTRQYPRRPRMKLTKQVPNKRSTLKATTRGERRATMCVPQQPDNPHVHFTISNFIPVSCVFQAARLYLHAPGLIIILAAVDFKAKNKNFYHPARTRGRQCRHAISCNWFHLMLLTYLYYHYVMQFCLQVFNLYYIMF